MEVNDKKDNVSVNFIKINKTLNPKFWDKDETLNKEIRIKLLEISKHFIEYLLLPNGIKIDDIIFTGSLANFNYNEQSDIDLHILIDFNNLEGDPIMIKEYFDNKKNLFNDRYKIIIKKYPIELYVQDTHQPLEAKGVYSVLKNEWNKTPEHPEIKFDKEKIREKALEIIKEVNELVKNPDLIKIDKLKKKIKDTRQKGLYTDAGEYSIENLVFKVLRRGGYIQKLYDLETKETDKELSLNEMSFKNIYKELKDNNKST